MSEYTNKLELKGVWKHEFFGYNYYIGEGYLFAELKLNSSRSVTVGLLHPWPHKESFISIEEAFEYIKMRCQTFMAFLSPDITVTHAEHAPEVNS